MKFIIFLSYIFLATFISFASLDSKILNIPFGYDDNLVVGDFFYMYPICISTLFFIGGYIFVRDKSISIHVKSNPVSFSKSAFSFGVIKKVNLYLLFVQILMLFYWVSKIISNYDEIQNSNIIIFRVLVGKETFFLLFIQAMLPLAAKGLFRSIFSFFSLFVALSFAWFDGSRAALIPLSLLMLTNLALNRKLTFSLLLMLQFFIYFFVANSRYVDDKLNFNLLLNTISESILNVQDGFFGLIAYTFGYSILHFIATTKNELGNFTSSDLLYSIIPLPSSLIPINVNVELWRVDAFRPMGAVSELYRVSSFALYFFFFGLGGLVKKLDTMNIFLLKAITMPIFSMVTIFIFQYHLRAVMWFLFLLMLLVFLDKYLIKKRKLNNV
ncbi:hypothetical protein [Vibrio parahaemolyticus]|uniref:hypothetical protein n=1 Tax=Vibrio parahaemolyticus TaxID=670 RepID=UPI00044790A0|nr:hypothetical protein [Vibrio parahaemolyticus]EGQ7828673.1 hypothetical protein [Vibrio parahaemolyticus]EGQ9825678.1 hypothetical protein [Vibrio parahaemolyticus]EGR0255034.1 hypothetical protein [Vibrio parahaemolyticus]EHR6655488.1 hypothetical protein [Vibrio parahaemolyticus]EJB0376061.1 hypothetical protein [Vibrio parahaemolyticus]